MNNKKKTGLIAFAVILLSAALLCCFFLLTAGNGENKTAYIYSGGELLYCIDLSGENKVFTVKTDSGYNKVCLKNGKIGVIEADCPDKTCIKTGLSDSPFMPVICMPHRLEIVIKSGAIETDGVSR